MFLTINRYNEILKTLPNLNNYLKINNYTIYYIINIMTKFLVYGSKDGSDHNFKILKNKNIEYQNGNSRVR